MGSALRDLRRQDVDEELTGTYLQRVSQRGAHRQAGLDITPETPIPDWLGEQMDDSMAVEGLLQLE